MLIPRNRLFGGRDRSSPAISPDGELIAFTAVANGVNNAWVAPATELSEARAVTGDTEFGIQQLYWARTSRHLILVRDRGGDEKWWLQCLELASGKTVQLSPQRSAESRLVALSDRFPTEILIECNARDPAYFDVYRVNLLTGESAEMLRNDRYTWFYADYLLRLRMAELRTDDGGIEYHRSAGDGRWDRLYSISAEDEAVTRPFRTWETLNTFGPDDLVYAVDSRNRNTGALVTWNLATGETCELASDSRADIAGAIIHPATRELLGYVTNYERPVIHPLCESLQRDLEMLAEDTTISMSIESQSREARRRVVAISAPDRPAEYVLTDSLANHHMRLYCEREELAEYRLAKMYPETVKTRDGLELLCYLTLPPDTDQGSCGRPDTPSPLVMLVHGGPWIRDEYGFDPWAQLLADRGYAVLNVNFRGSRGFGKVLLNAGDREWGGKMYDDVVDAVRWAVAEGIADERRLAIMGASFGGYTTLAGLTRTPELFSCGIDLFGVSNLETFLATIPAHWKNYRAMWDRRVGALSSAEGRAFLRERSPIHHVGQIVRPVLVGQGSNDPRVVQAESDQMVAALQAQGTPVIYALYPDEGHSFERLPNKLSFFCLVEHFLARYLGGRCEPFDDSLVRSSLTVPVGAELLPGLEQFLKFRDKHQSEDCGQ